MENQKEKFVTTYPHLKQKLMPGAFLWVITWIRCSVVLNLTQHVSVIPQSATITVTSGFMCLLVSILFTSPVWQLMELVVLTENFNKGLMNESEEETEEVTSSNDDNSRDLELSSAEEAEKYYNNYSEAWQRKVNGIINTYSNIHHPTKANHSHAATNSNVHSEKFSSNITHKSPFNSFTVCYVITNWKCHKLAFPSCIFTIHHQWPNWQQCMHIYCTCFI